MNNKKHRKPGARPAAPRWRSRTLAAIVLLAVIGGGVWWLWSPQDASGGTPRLVLDRDKIDLGAVPLGTTVRAVFTMKNAGDGTLKITDVSPVKVVEGC